MRILKRNRIIAIIGIALMILLITAGCGSNKDDIQPTKIIVDKEPVYVDVKKEKQLSSGEVLSIVLAAVSIFGAGYGTCKYGKNAINSIKKIF